MVVVGVRSKVLYILLALSLVGNVFLGWRWHQSETHARSALVDLTRNTIDPLNTVVLSLLSPSVPWNSPTYGRDLYTLLNQASSSGTAAGDLAGSVSGEAAEVALSLHQLSFEISEYRLLASKLRDDPSSFSAEDKKKLRAWAQTLHDGGWPITWVLESDLAPYQGWSRLRTTLDQTVTLARQ